jgi:riboflavin biosynthesis pyrimidine reductase
VEDLEAAKAGAVHTQAFRRLGAVDELRLIVLPVLLGAGVRLTPALSTDAGLTLKEQHVVADRAVEIVYACASSHLGSA